MNLKNLPLLNAECQLVEPSGDQPWDDPTLYAAYGSNLSLSQMAVRCPEARPVARVILEGWRLNFRRVADVEPGASYDHLPLGVWSVKSAADRDALDRYEGWPRLYRREILHLKARGNRLRVVLYRMNKGDLCPPHYDYRNTIWTGYEAWGFKPNAIRSALSRAKSATPF